MCGSQGSLGLPGSCWSGTMSGSVRVISEYGVSIRHQEGRVFVEMSRDLSPDLARV